MVRTGAPGVFTARNYIFAAAAAAVVVVMVVRVHVTEKISLIKPRGNTADFSRTTHHRWKTDRRVFVSFEWKKPTRRVNT